MIREPITAELVEEIDRLLAQGIDPATISGRLNVSEYVVRVIDGDVIGKGRRPRPGRYDSRVANSAQGIDAVTIQRIERMLAVGWLEQEQVAREAGVSPNTVSEIALGRRPVSTTRCRKSLNGQFALRDPIRCNSCGASVYIVPCQACYARLITAIDQVVRTFFHGFLKSPLPAWSAFVDLDPLMEHLKRTRGAKTMQDVTSTLSTELAALIAAKDKREYLISRTERLFDEVVEPIDLPGPDRIVDPLLRAAIRPLVGRVYDEMLKKLEAPAANAA